MGFKKQLFAGFIVAAVIAASACGSSSDQEVIAGGVADELAGTGSLDTAKLDARELVLAAMNTPPTVAMRATVTSDMGPAGSTAIHYEIDKNANMRMTMLQDAGLEDAEAQVGSEILIIDGVGYARFILPDEVLAESDIEIPVGWLTLGRETMELLGVSCGPPIPGSGLNSEACTPPNDVSEMSDYVLAATIVGSETVHGVETTRIQTALDFKSLLEAALDENSGDSLMALMLATFPDEIATELWIDADLRIHRMSLDMTLDVAAFGEELGTDIDADRDESQRIVSVMEFYDFGADITIEAPPPEEIVGEFGEWLEKLGFSTEISDDPISSA
ncbi:hypothetical protein [Candidatus Poriferisodalis sp.]|uniref:hypothetical protein n=1 Tax=Candidatus Poriferisodalis sp. TaxID=3101277 RepID=UPI003C6F013B